MCSYKLFLLVLSVQSITNTYGQRQKKFFRKDYTFLEETQSFYKIHTIAKTWKEAKTTCVMEGSALFYAESKTELDAVSKYWQEKQQFDSIFVGIASLVIKGIFETIHAIPISDVYNNWRAGEPNDVGGEEDCVLMQRTTGEMNDVSCNSKHAFICKKPLASLEWNKQCDMPRMEYVYNEFLERCYKFHLKPREWIEAYRYCSAEQSHLAVINSQAEADYLVTLTEQALKYKVKQNFTQGVVLLGFHNRNNDGWNTVLGATPLEDSGYDVWANEQPDGDTNEQCGSMTYDGCLNDVACGAKGLFICEHELKSNFHERFSEQRCDFRYPSVIDSVDRVNVN